MSCQRKFVLDEFKKYIEPIRANMHIMQTQLLTKQSYLLDNNTYYNHRGLHRLDTETLYLNKLNITNIHINHTHILETKFNKF